MKAFDLQFISQKEADDARLLFLNMGITANRMREGTELHVSQVATPDWKLDEQFWRMMKIIIQLRGLATPRFRVRELK
jgi:hypothetical protein